LTVGLLSLIVALDQQGVIGYKKRLPWYLPTDLKHFRTITMGKAIIMGRKTSESIGKPLDGRINIVLSRTHKVITGYQQVHSLEEALTLSQRYSESIVIGGAMVYQQLLPYVQRMYLTRIHATFTGDTFFPQYQPQQWREIERQDYLADDNNPYSCSFITLTRKV
jgi:dihydrofolate reductase